MSTTALVPAAPSTSTTPRFAVHVVAGTHPAAELGRRIEAEVFADAFGNTRAQLDAEYRPYDEASVFLLVVDQRIGDAVGVMRIIVPNPAGLKSVVDLARAPWREDPAAVVARTPQGPDLAHTWDIATLAVSRNHRGVDRVVSRALTTAFGHLTVASLRTTAPALWWVTMLDVPVLQLLQRTWNEPFVPWPGVDAGPYLDSVATMPVWADTQAWIARCEDDAPQLHRRIHRPTDTDRISYPTTASALAPILAVDARTPSSAARTPSSAALPRRRCRAATGIGHGPLAHPA